MLNYDEGMIRKISKKNRKVVIVNGKKNKAVQVVNVVGQPAIGVNQSICDESGKICYSRRDAAITVATGRKEKRLGKRPIRYYQCGDCGCYHTTSQK